MQSPNHGDRRGQLVSLVVLHYTAMTSCAAAIQRLCDPVHEVSAHWVVSRSGDTVQLVDESRRAWHAGAGSWQGQGDVNSRSVGIELDNDGTSPFPDPQMCALERLLTGIMSRHAIAPEQVIGHQDMAPTRKPDPGPRFDWARLARSGLAVHPRASAPRPAQQQAVLNDLVSFGYPGDDPVATLTAFRCRTRPWATGPLDGWDAALAHDLATRYGLSR